MALYVLGSWHYIVLTHLLFVTPFNITSLEYSENELEACDWTGTF
jgi:ABC-type uncharacterized transport system YnjBCD permease subunit